MNFKCPNNHEVPNVERTTPVCKQCDLVATWFNRRTGEVHTWENIIQYEKDCQRLQDAMDAAFDNQYFGGDY